MISRVRGCKPHRVGANLLFGIHFAGKYKKMKMKTNWAGGACPSRPPDPPLNTWQRIICFQESCSIITSYNKKVAREGGIPSL